MAGQQDREERRAAMAGRQNGNSKEKGKEVEGKKGGHQFCRVFAAKESGERLVRVFESLVNLCAYVSIHCILIV
jgi:hypothetical protein